MILRFTSLFALVALLACTQVRAQEELREPDEVHSIDGVLNDTLVMAISPINIGDRVITSRLYNGGCPGPTWRLKRGELLRVFLRNQLPLNPDQDSADQGNYPQRINTTNLHVHGLNVTPRDSGDNVLQSILPGEDFQFHIQLPQNHAAGSYWYHPHHHTSTYGQVVSGLAGSIIIEDVDDPLVSDPALLAIEDRVFVFSVFSYDTTTNTLPYPRRLTSATALRPFNAIVSKAFVNGMNNAKVTLRPGEIQRWRFINATFNMNMDLRWLKIVGTDTTLIDRPEIAVDGLYFDEPFATPKVLVTTGGRSDVLVQAPTDEGRYILQMMVRNSQMVLQETRELISIVVAGDAIIPPMTMPSRLPAAIARGPVHDSEITGHRTVTFSLGDFSEIATDSTAVTRMFKINNSPFDHEVVNISVTAGDAEEWIIDNESDDFHPFHIHVNEFQVLEKNGVKLNPPRWQDVLLLDTLSTYKIRHRFGEHYGKTVLHCHYLNHEDWGMMNIIEILPKVSGVESPSTRSPLAFPNPIVGRIDRVSVRIPDFLSGRTVTITLTDVVGQPVSIQTVDASDTRLATMDVTTLSAGTYFLTVDGGGAYNETDMIVLVR